MPVSVCHLTCAHEPFDVRIFEKECVSLAGAGYRVTLVAPNANNQTVRGVEVVGVRAKSLNPLVRVFWLARRVYKRALAVDAEIYHFHDIELFRYGLMLKRRGKKVIFDSHEDWPQYAKEIAWLPRFVRNWLAKAIVRGYKKHLHLFDVVVTVSPHIVDSLQRDFHGEVKMITNYPFLPRQVLNVTLDNYLQRKNTLFYAGSVYSNASQVEIVRAIQHIDNIEYRIVGKISPVFRKELTGFDKKGRVHFTDWVTKSELEELYAQATAGIVLFEYGANVGFNRGTMGNNKIFEYMAMGLPIICTNFTSWRKLIVDKYKCGICVEPKSEKELIEAISLLICNKELAYQMGQNGQRAVEEEFNWRTQERVLLQTYESIAGA